MHYTKPGLHYLNDKRASNLCSNGSAESTVWNCHEGATYNYGGCVDGVNAADNSYSSPCRTGTYAYNSGSAPACGVGDTAVGPDGSSCAEGGGGYTNSLCTTGSGASTL
ncbi:MAG: hypothetical protein ABIA04_01295 [Pseudomonadota bacterium]